MASAEKALFLAKAFYEAARLDLKYMPQAKPIYIAALSKNAYMQKSAQIRNYYLSVAQELEQQ